MMNKIMTAAFLLALALAGVTQGQDGDAGKPRLPSAGRPPTPSDALAYLKQRDWARAAAAYQQLVRTDPENGEHWYNLSFALYALKRPEEAIAGATKAAELGFQPGGAFYNVACLHALLGHKEEALTTLEKALAAGFGQDNLLRTNRDLAKFRGDARFQKLLSIPADGLSREERWRLDLDYLARRLEQVHYSLFAKVSRRQFREALDDVKRRVGALNDDEIAVGIQRVVALVGDGHTRVLWDGGPSYWPTTRPRYAVEFYEFKEGLHIRAAAPELAHIVGGKVVRIGNVSAEQAVAAVSPLCSHDNAMGVKLMAPKYLTNPAALSFLKLAADPKSLTLIVKTMAGREETVSLKPFVISAADRHRFIRANISARAPEQLCLKGNEDKFWFEWIPESKLVYLQLNEIGNKAKETLEQFCTRLFGAISEKSAEYLVVDLRNTSHGDNLLNRPLVHGLIRCDRVNRPGHLFVLIGRDTFSAGMNCAVDIERNTQAIFVGEPSGSSPNHVGEGNVLVLPCSGLEVLCSTLYWQSSLPYDRRHWIAPLLPAEPSIAALAANQDPGLEAILAYIEEGSSTK